MGKPFYCFSYQNVINVLVYFVWHFQNHMLDHPPQSIKWQASSVFYGMHMFCVATFHINYLYTLSSILHFSGQWCLGNYGVQNYPYIFLVSFTHGMHSYLVSTCNKAYDFYAFSSYSFIVTGWLVIALSALHRLQALQGHSG